MAASSNFGNMFSMVGASALLPFLPMAPIQILFNNLLYDFSQTAVASDFVDNELLQSPRQWDISNITRFILCIGPISSLFDYLTFGLLWFTLKAQTVEQSAIFHTGWFVESLLSQTLIVHIIRTGKIPFIQSRPSRLLLLTTIGICALGAALPYTPLSSFLAMTPLPSDYWFGMLILLPSYLLLTQLVKQWLIKRYGLS
jgi:Mg2+-importing ATPase